MKEVNTEKTNFESKGFFRNQSPLFAAAFNGITQKLGVGETNDFAGSALGYLAVDTRSNAGEAAQWLKEHDYTSVRLVTTDWHMAWAASEFAGTLPPQIDVLKDAVPSHPNLPTLFLEYNKLLAAAISQGLPD